MRISNHLFRCSSVFVRTMLVWMLAMAIIVLSVSPSYAASAAKEEDQGVYARLAAGHKVQMPRDFVRPEQPTVYLTFDDGPSKLTPQVLDILANEQVKATFFELGGEAGLRPDIVKRVVEEGHALGNHTYDHIYSKLYGSYDEFWRQVQQTDQVFEDIVGFRPRLLRAPGGTGTNFDAYYFYYLDQAGYLVYDWNMDSGDSKRAGVPAKEIIDTVKKGPFTHDVTLLMHDGTGHMETVRALPEIIRIFKEKGYSFASLSEHVKPEQFAITKPKWSRSMPYSKFDSLAAEMRIAGEEHLRAVTGTGAGAGSGSEAVPVLLPPPPPPDNDVQLQLRIASRLLTLPAGGYELAQGMLRVPLRSLAESMGSAVRWDERTRIATVRSGIRELQYDMNAKSLRSYTLGKLQREYPYADMKLMDGSIVVPLRTTVALLGGGIGDWSMDRDGRYVTVAQKRLIFEV